MNLSVGGEKPELHEMVAAAAGAQLPPGAILVLFCDRAYVPFGIQHLVLPAVLEAGVSLVKQVQRVRCFIRLLMGGRGIDEVMTGFKRDGRKPGAWNELPGRNGQEKALLEAIESSRLGQGSVAGDEYLDDMQKGADY